MRLHPEYPLRHRLHRLTDVGRQEPDLRDSCHGVADAGDRTHATKVSHAPEAKENLAAGAAQR